jgi:DNA-binding transcriptional ArsR family regulator
MASTTILSRAELASLFDLLSDETRLQLVFRLARGACNVMTLCEDLKHPQPNISHHLGLLRMNHLVMASRTGKQVYYSLAENVKVSNDKLMITLPSHTVTIAETGGQQTSSKKRHATTPQRGQSLFDIS